MAEKIPFETSTISIVLGIPYGKLYRWLKNNLLEYSTPKAHEKLHKHDLPANLTGSTKDVLVPIMRQGHIGSHMAIDEKYINGEFYTVFSNGTTGKVALLCSTIKSPEIKACLNKFSDLENITYLTRDLSSTYEKVATENFPNAIQIADKFHVVRHAIDTIQSIRRRLKQEELTKQRLEQKKHDKNYKESKNKTLIGPKMNLKKKYQPKRIENGETLPELLSRSIYLVCIERKKWNEYQQKRATLLFKYFPILEKAYQVILNFRNWYKKKDDQYEPFQNDKILGNLLDEMESIGNNELNNFKNLVENNYEVILNYHKYNHKTNAIAESINARIMDVIRKNRGTRDIDYFNYRLGLII